MGMGRVGEMGMEGGEMRWVRWRRVGEMGMEGV